MMPAAKMMDPVMGIDIHIIQPPGPVPPLPIPHPFVGMLFDPMELAPVIGATVFVNGMPKATAGSEGKALPPHIPIGGMFVPPPPGNECEMFMGSSTVLFEGEPASYTALPALSCQSVGMPAPFRPKKKPKPILKLPTSVVMPIPAGPPVLIGGPPTISMTVIGMKLAMGAAMKAAKKLKKAMKASKRVKAASDKIHKAAKKAMDKLGVPPSVQNKVHKGICTVTGHPVDVATGKVFTDQVDFEMPGPLPLRWERTWYSTSVYNGPLGYGWHHNYDLALREEEGAVAVRMADGRPVGFPVLKPGGSFYNRQEKLTLGRDERGYWLEDEERVRHRFEEATPDGSHPLSHLEDRNGFRIEFQRDPMGRLVRILDSAGRVLSVQSDGLGRITAIHIRHPEFPSRTLALARYQYNERGNLVQATDVLGKAWQYQYQGFLLARETNRNGLAFHFEWEGSDHTARCVRTYGDGGIYDHKLSYDLAAKTTVVTDSLGHRTAYHWNEDGLVEKTVDPLGHVHATTFTPFAEIASEIDPQGLATVFAYDDRGNLISVQEPDGSKVETAYSEDRPVAATDALGGKWQWEYDQAGRLIRRVDPTGAEIRSGYENGLLSEVTDAEGAVTRLAYDGSGNLVSLALPDGAESRWEYDYLGRCTAAVNPLGNRQERKYDEAGNIVRVVEPDGNQREFAYDGEENLVHAKDIHSEVRYEFQGMDRLKAMYQGGARVAFEYDTEERLTGIVNEHGHAYRFELDPTGEVSVETGFDGSRRLYERDEKGLVTRLRNANGLVSKYVYDAADRILAIERGDGEAEAFTYRADGLVMSVENAEGAVKFERDLLGRVLKESWGGHFVVSEYDKAGRRIAMRSSLGAAQRIVRNAVGDAQGVAAGRGADENGFKAEWEARFQRDLLGQELDRALPGGLRATWKRDALGRPIRHLVHGRHLSRDRSYEWEPNDRIKTIMDSQFGVRDFGYDPFGALAWSSLSQEFTIRAPDAIGNLFRTGDQEDRKYGPDGRLLEARTRDGVTTYAYDAEGNLVRKEARGPDHAETRVWTYEWDASDQLIRLVRPDGREVRFAYDPVGRRVRKIFGDRITHWIWDADVPLHEWVTEKTNPGDLKPASGKPAASPSGDLLAKQQAARLADQPSQGPPEDPGPDGAEAGTETAPITWLFEPDSFAPMAKLVGERKYSILTDHLGTPYAMADAEGREAWSADIDIYGARKAGKGHAQLCPFRFPGQYEDQETGLYYNRFRYYDPEAGLYVSRDPIGPEGGFNLYAYVPDPLAWTDPYGLAKKQPCGAGTQRWRNKKTKSGRPYKKPGPKTNPNAPHNKKIQAVINREKRKGKIHVGGGSKTEVIVPTPGGKKPYRRMDATFKDPETGKIEHHNVGKSNRGRGDPVARERDAISDVEDHAAPKDKNITFHSYGTT